jgi:hypothetical protein
VIKFENIRTGEVVEFTGAQEVNARNAHMAAYLNASDLSPNAGIRGQDFGWRLAPEVIAEMELVRNDYDSLERISKRLGVGIDDIRDFHILSYVAERSFAEDAKAARANQPAPSDLEDDYRARVKAAKQGTNPDVVKVTAPVEAQNFTVTTTKDDASVKLEVPTTKKEK